MSVLRPGDIAAIAFVRESTTFTDPYRLVRTGPATKGLQASSRDAQGNRIIPDVVIEDGYCQLLKRALQPQERLIADSLGWTLAYAINMPAGSLVDPDHRVLVAGRTFHVGGVARGGEWTFWLTVVAEERSS